MVQLALGVRGALALVRTIQAEAARFPPAVLRAWQDTRPRAFQQELAGYLSQMADHGLLALDDADTAALHCNLLTFISVAQRSFYGALPLGEAEITELVIGGVKAFLRLYRTDGVEQEASGRTSRGWILR
ncbi:TetR/AcrR family transcriptional regulator C-terminal domain-containing protein [Streptomyces poonensis]|uniref:Transcriptional regulator TetR C-terminal Proteobacteria type domain-containing protein n=1 Tax=Streptomyces poonensis TaxID=68255 RepID=A0A918QCD3_9ACTN|nr:TetR/AcrR family transcriptional regulator C-terminal domain-containing protein [Streptomyces poonensis]GGZ39984.1 hypothetical protein GCM10010365_71030 [Streptomyces poonensis]GLJ92881.1 hypothetical protein GCM10017589_54920 [Streptomyces poonensis]